MVVPKDAGVSDARRAYITVKVSIELAMHAAEDRVTQPESYPCLPTTGLADWLTRKTMADLLELGFAPEGWEDAYFTTRVGGDA